MKIRSHAYMKPASDSIISTLVGFSRAQFNDAYFWSHSNCAFGYGLHTAFHGGTYRALYASRRSRCDSSDRAVELCDLCAVHFSQLACWQCGYLRFLSEPPLYFSSSFLFCQHAAVLFLRYAGLFEWRIYLCFMEIRNLTGLDRTSQK